MGPLCGVGVQSPGQGRKGIQLTRHRTPDPGIPRPLLLLLFALVSPSSGAALAISCLLGLESSLVAFVSVPQNMHLLGFCRPVPMSTALPAPQGRVPARPAALPSAPRWASQAQSRKKHPGRALGILRTGSSGERVVARAGRAEVRRGAALAGNCEGKKVRGRPGRTGQPRWRQEYTGSDEVRAAGGSREHREAQRWRPRT